MNRTDTNGDCRSLVREITICISAQSQKLSELRKEITAYTGNFSEDNVFAFKTSFSDDKEYMDFACDLKEFIDEDKVSEYQLRINTRNSDIFRQITADTKSMVSQEGNIRGVVDQINADFKEKNFVEARIIPVLDHPEFKVEEIRQTDQVAGISVQLHCMMDEIGKLHPNNVAGILKFANDRDILLINGAPSASPRVETGECRATRWLRFGWMRSQGFNMCSSGTPPRYSLISSYIA